MLLTLLLLLGVPAAVDAGAQPTGKELLKRLDEMQAELKDRPKTAEIQLALGNLYYDNGRWPDAIDAYRGLLERAAVPVQQYLALRRKGHKHLTAAQAHCGPDDHPTYESLVADADAKAKAGDVDGAAACGAAAMAPVLVALTRQANAWYLIGNEDLAIAIHRKALELAPDDPDNLFFLGAIFFEGGEGDVPKLKQAEDAWKRFLEVTDPKRDPERRKIVARDLVRVQRAIDNKGTLPAENAAP